MRKPVHSLAIVLLALLPCAAKADTIDTISLSFNLQPQIYSSQVTEQFSAAFDYDLDNGKVLPGTMQTSSIGPIDPFSASFTSLGTVGFPKINWYNSDNDWVQFDWDYVHTSPIEVGDTVASMFWQCSIGDTCATIFGSGNTRGLMTVTDPPPIATPEPAMWLLLLTGLMGLALWRRKVAHVNS